MVSSQPQSVLPSERSSSLDLIRGFALFGIALVNVLDFSVSDENYLHFREIPVEERWILGGIMVFCGGKFLSLFSLLFGAGLRLLTQKLEESGKSSGVVLRRLGWLWVFGILHAYLIWYGDILVGYAVTGFLIYWCRNWGLQTQATVGIVLVSLVMLFYGTIAALVGFFVDDSMLSEASFEAESGNFWDEEAFGKGWLDQMPLRASYAFIAHIFLIPFFVIPYSGGLMLLGMAMLRSGFFHDRWSRKRYVMQGSVCLAVGLLLVGIEALLNARAGWELMGFARHAIFGFLAAPLLMMGYASFLAMWSRTAWLGWLQAGFRSMGRMALSNYLCQSLIFSWIFYGHGLGLSQEFPLVRVVSMVVLPTLAIQMVASILWLRAFQFGPFEWLWRSLTYFRLMPIR
ncbi:MAG: DUF418 domain-containing protein [Verrucomicrobiota bacterium]